jgi:hypothetical protein
MKAIQLKRSRLGGGVKSISRRGFVLATGAAVLALPRSVQAVEAPPLDYAAIKTDKTKPIPDITQKVGDWKISTEGLLTVHLLFPELKRHDATGIGFKSGTEAGREVELPSLAMLSLNTPTQDLKLVLASPTFVVDKEIYSNQDQPKQVVEVDIDGRRFGTFDNQCPACGIDALNPQFLLGDLTSPMSQKFVAALSAGRRLELVVSMEGRALYTLTCPLTDAGRALSAAREELAFRAKAAAEGRVSKQPETYSGYGSKVVCTAMNERYGFGAFRNSIWLAYASQHLTPAHERGYHRWALPLVRFSYAGESLARRVVRAIIEHIARERTADIWAEMRGARRRPLGRLYRAVLEPLSWLLGQL